MTAARNMCFTLNNYTVKEIDEIKAWDFQYLIIGYEIGEESKTPHIQGYVEWKNAKRITTLKKLNGRIHWEARKGSAEQAANYCKKEGNFLEFGKMKAQGKRTDLEDAADAIKQKKFIDREFVIEYTTTFIRYHRGFEKVADYLSEPRKDAPMVYWRWGKSGTGKTRFIYDNFEADKIYMKDSSMWWDGYTPNKHTVILIDEYDGTYDFRTLLRLLDRYPFQGQRKGGYVQINSPWIYITSEHPPIHYFPHESELNQVIRRCTEVTEVTEGNTKASV
jgi:hypothetical protein